jgi:uroporphyrin-III C-methyltransferase/precorrin-2 dehydrogenase/sirohydrochlorin ferrochelatase
VIGRVSLVGAGPGDPELLTIRAQQRLADADLVLYDAIAAPALKALAPEARWFFVGKRAGRESIAQDAINRIMIREAKRGRHIVRLKGGDPFVLGRGGEEALALGQAGVPFEVVPGLSSALAAPALAGIPVTHRGLASGCVVVSGHAPSAYTELLEALPPGAATVVVMMGLGARADIAALLLGRGWSPATPAAIVLGAAMPEAWRWLGPLGALAGAALPADRVAAGVPGVLVVGDVVALAELLAGDFGAEGAAEDEAPEKQGAAE